MPETASPPRMQVPDAALETARLKLDAARWAAAKLARLDRAATLKIAEAVAAAGHAKARDYAEQAVRETGFGVVAHKIIKNEACSKGKQSQCLFPSSARLSPFRYPPFSTFCSFLGPKEALKVQ